MSRARAPLDFAREWFSFVDPDDKEHQIRADLTWLLSSWTCIFGSGCKGILKTGPDNGCCSHGAFFSDKEDERRVRGFVKQLTPEDWQYHAEGKLGGWTEIGEDDKRRKTRVVDDACIFHNRPGFEGGMGCALHKLALRIGKHPLETKPDVCWQLPIHQESEWVDRDDETQIRVTSISEFDRRGWGSGGHDLDWWCTEDPIAHTGAERLYITYGPELSALIGAPAYAVLKEHCDARVDTLIATHPASP